MRCYRRILKICWKDKVSNNVIRERVKRQLTVMDMIKQRKLKLLATSAEWETEDSSRP